MFYNRMEIILAKTLIAKVKFTVAKTKFPVIAQHCSLHKEVGQKYRHVCWAYGLESQLILALFLDLYSHVAFCFFLSNISRKIL